MTARLKTLSIAPFCFHPRDSSRFHRGLPTVSSRTVRGVFLDASRSTALRGFMRGSFDRLFSHRRPIDPLLAPKRIARGLCRDLSRSRKRAARTSPARASERVARRPVARRSSLVARVAPGVPRAPGSAALSLARPPARRDRDGPVRLARLLAFVTLGGADGAQPRARCRRPRRRGERRPRASRRRRGRRSEGRSARRMARRRSRGADSATLTSHKRPSGAPPPRVPLRL